MRIIKLGNNTNLLQNNTNFNKKTIQILISVTNILRNTNNYYIMHDFKNCVINILNTIDKLIESICSSMPNIAKVKLACVHAITDDMDESCIGDCGDTSIILTFEQFLCFHINKIHSIVIDCCKNILINAQRYDNNNITKNNSNNNQNIIIYQNIISCINKMWNILECLSHTNIQELSPVCKKFNYSVLNNKIHNNICPLLRDINKLYDKYC